MKLFYYPLENFGDRPLNTWLWPQLLPTQLDDDNDTLLVGIGSLLNDKLPTAPLKVIFGSGAGYFGEARPDERWRVYCVRGPGTARRLGLAPELALADGAVLVRALGRPSPPKTYRVAYMPHWSSDYHGNWQRICELAGVHFIDPAAAVETILDDIQRSELVLSEALHGAIVADALRVPWAPVKAYRHISEFKWHDWCDSIGLAYRPAHLPACYQARSVGEKLHERMPAGVPRWAETLIVRLGKALAGPIYQYSAGRCAEALQRLAANARQILSSDPVIDRVTTRLLEKLELLKYDFAHGQIALAQN